jgi:hypothetical protein
VRALRGATKQCVDELDFTNNPGHALPTTDHAHDFEALDSGVGSLHRLKATGWAEDSLDATMVWFDDVVQIFRGAVVLPLSFPSRCRRWMALGYEPSLSIAENKYLHWPPTRT